MVRRPPFFYGWVSVGIAVVGVALVMGIRHSFAVFFPPILEEFTWSRGSTAMMLSLNLFIYGLMAPVAGSLGDRWKPRRVMLIGIAIVGLATGLIILAAFAIAVFSVGLGIGSFMVALDTDRRINNIDATLARMEKLQDEIKKAQEEQPSSNNPILATLHGLSQYYLDYVKNRKRKKKANNGGKK